MTAPGTATQLALQSAADRPLLYDDDRTFRGSDLDLAVGALASELQTSAGPDAVIGMWGWNSAEMVAAHLAAERAGMTRVPIDPEAPAAEARAILAAVGARLVIVDSEHTADVGCPARLLTDDVWAARGGDITVPDRDRGHVALRIVRGIDGGGLINIPLTQDNWDAHMRQSATFLRTGVYGHAVGPGSVYLTVQQLQYGTGLVGTFPFIRMGLPQVVLKRFDADAVIRAVEQHRTTTTFLVPGMLTRLCERLAGHDLSEWTLHVLYGGAPLSLPAMLHVTQMLGPQRLSQLYGRFEGGWPIAVLDGNDHQRIAAGEHRLARSCGRVVPGIDVDYLHHVAGDERAELRVRSNCTAPTYTDADGWCALGDLVTLDQEGHLYLSGRLDGMINTGAFHVYPAEVQAAISAEFPEVKSVHVVGRPDERWGQAVSAIMDWTDTTLAPTRDEFRRRMSTRLAKYKVPTHIEHRDITATGPGGTP